MGYRDEIFDSVGPSSNIPSRHESHVRTAGTTSSPTIPSSMKKRPRDLESNLHEGSDIQSEINSGLINTETQIDNVPPKKIRIQEYSDVNNNLNKRPINSGEILNQSSIRNKLECCREIMPVSDINFNTIDELKTFVRSETLKSKESELKRFERQNNINAVKKLESEIYYYKTVRRNILTKLGYENTDADRRKLHCNMCDKPYIMEGSFINHIFDCHPEKIVKNSEFADETNSVCDASEISRPIVPAESSDDDTDLDTRSESSEINMFTPPHLIQYPSINEPPSNRRNDSPKITQIDDTECNQRDNSQESASNSRNDSSEIRQIDEDYSLPTNNATDPTASRSQEVREIPREPINLFGSESSTFFEKESPIIRSWIKGDNRSSKINPRQCKEKTRKNGKIQNVSAEDKLRDYYMMTKVYSNDELKEISHCCGKKTKDVNLCNRCQEKLVRYQSDSYAQSTKAFREQEEIKNNQALNKNEKKRLLKDLYEMDEYRGIRERLENIRDRRKRFHSKYFKIIEKALNDNKLRQFVELNLENYVKLQLSDLCLKLLDDIANEFLTRVTTDCMISVNEHKRIVLSENHLLDYRFRFQVTNIDSKYYQHIPRDIQEHMKSRYGKFLPNTTNLELILTECLLRHSFGDKYSTNLDDLMFEHIKSPQPIFKFLNNEKFSKPYLTRLTGDLLKFLMKITLQLLEIKKAFNSGSRITLDELIRACENVRFFHSSYISSLKTTYGR